MKILNLFGKSVVSIAVFGAFCGANAATGRTGSNGGGSSARMPTMPTVTLNTIGNPAVTTIGHGGQSNGLPTINPNNPNNPDHPDHPDHPTPSNCPDGGVENSQYTVAMCMADLQRCVENGSLQGGMRDLFDQDVRNSIMTGMSLCQTVVDQCVKEVRINCRNVYNETPDVWLDFNSRVIQPEYYNFVLRKTGLTPNQAENTCLLLDRNTYGSSFAAVSDINEVNTEYQNRVGAYNEANNGQETKDNPQGVEVNTTGYDGNRGHYARWDAKNAECLIRVAAYNKDNLITNKWLGFGDDSVAEVWQKSGGTFICNKDLFDFSLMNKTKSAALISVPVGAGAGALVGGLVGQAVYDKKVNDNKKVKEENYKSVCENETYRRNLADKIAKLHKTEVLRTYFCEGNVDEKSGEKESISYNNISCKHEISDFQPNNAADAGENTKGIAQGVCEDIYHLYDKIALYEERMKLCEDAFVNNSSSFDKVDSAAKSHIAFGDDGGCKVEFDVQAGCTPVEQQIYKDNCTFKPLNTIDEENDPVCKPGWQCLKASVVKRQIARLKKLLSEIGVNAGVDRGEVVDADKGKDVGKGIAIGTVTGAGVGGIVTGITALVERSNITCKVGDGLNSVGYGKSHTIDTLKDFYVKWNLNLPDYLSPTAVVTDWESWHQACRQFNSRLMDCEKVTINLKTKTLHNKDVYENVTGACKKAGTACVGNETIMLQKFPVPVIPAVVVPFVNP